MQSRIILLIGLALICSAPGARAGDDQAPAPPSIVRSPQTPDFLLREPRGWIGLNGGWLFPRTDGDLFRFFSDQLTIEKEAFRSKELGMEVGVAATRRLDIVGGVEGGRREIGSEYRDYVTPTRLPINQTTKLTRATMTIGARYAVLGHGRRLSRFAFVPRRVSPFVGAGVNVTHYKLQQLGQFVDFTDLGIFNHFYSSTGWGTGQYLQAGADVQIWRMVFLQWQGKYTWSRSDLGADFVGFDGMDLSGFRSGTGVSVVF